MDRGVPFLGKEVDVVVEREVLVQVETEPSDGRGQ